MSSDMRSLPDLKKTKLLLAVTAAAAVAK